MTCAVQLPMSFWWFTNDSSFHGSVAPHRRKYGSWLPISTRSTWAGCTDGISLIWMTGPAPGFRNGVCPIVIISECGSPSCEARTTYSLSWYTFTVGRLSQQRSLVQVGASKYPLMAPNWVQNWSGDQTVLRRKQPVKGRINLVPADTPRTSHDVKTVEIQMGTTATVW